MNLKDGLDWYSLSHQKYITTTKYTVSKSRPPISLVVDLIFVDEETVAVGHVDGYVSLVSYGHHTTELSAVMTIAKGGSLLMTQHKVY